MSQNINTLRGQKAELFIIVSCGTHSDH